MEKEKAYKLPMRVFELRGKNNESIKLRIESVSGFPNESSINGGYDVTCRLNINIGNYVVQNTEYPASTGTFYNFYTSLKTADDELYGTASYAVAYVDGAELNVDIEYADDGGLIIRGSYRDDQSSNTVLSFEFATDRTAVRAILADLKKIVGVFGTNKGI